MANELPARRTPAHVATVPGITHSPSSNCDHPVRKSHKHIEWIVTQLLSKIGKENVREIKRMCGQWLWSGIGRWSHGSFLILQSGQFCAVLLSPFSVYGKSAIHKDLLPSLHEKHSAILLNFLIVVLCS